MAIRAETRARALALQLLYAWDQGAGGELDRRVVWSRVLPLVRVSPAVRDRAMGMAEAALEARGRIDPQLERAADRWRLERLAVVDRNILRLAARELEGGTVPPKVAIDEAVRLARWFGGPKSPGFVNGILDRLAREMGRL